MRACRLLSCLGVTLPGRPLDFDVTSVECDSREVVEGSCFVAVAGSNADGHLFVAEAVRRGAGVVVVQEKVRVPLEVLLVRVDNTRVALARLAAQWHGGPAKDLKCIGITGTNGKTTTAYLLRHILESTGRAAGLVGTIEYITGKGRRAARQTTPGPLELHSLLAEMRDSGLKYAVMEVSSHALDQRRVDAVRFGVAVFTNLTHDHLDYHRDLDSYLAAKLALFRGLDRDGIAVVNADASRVDEVIEAATGARIFTYALDGNADFRASDLEMGVKGGRFTLCGPGGRRTVATQLVGRHNVYNCLAAVAAGASLGVAEDEISCAVETFEGVPGRLERIEAGGVQLFVDYAHTDDALRNVLGCLRRLGGGRLIVVFGCGGDRDKAKRPRMGAIAEELADVVIVTSDNPRSEDPARIARDILTGMTSPEAAQLVLDRRSAIGRALEMSRPGDCVLIAGKGHEPYQIFSDRRIDFDDRVTVRELIRSRSSVS